jgi:8-oxo-dGTP diphosphatase
MTAPGKALPVLRVVAALWRRHGKVFLAQRPEGKEHAGLWEFPGGKQELGERAKLALMREAEEELGVALRVGPEWAEVAERRPEVRLSMRIFQVVSDDEPKGIEGQKVAWFSADELADLPMPPMDDSLRERLIGELKRAEVDLWQSSFAWVRGVGDRIENALWKSGLRNQQEFLEFFDQTQSLDGVIGREQVIRLRQALLADDGLSDEERWKVIPARHRWRLLDAWSERCLALDFECDREGNPTVMGLALSPETSVAYMPETAVRWWLEKAPKELAGRWTDLGQGKGLLDGREIHIKPFAAALVELPLDGLILLFGGRKFDVAMLRKVFGDAPMPERYADLLDLSRRARLRGGLKAVERKFAISRDKRIAELRGRDAITLWDRAQADDEQGLWAFADLLAYNRADAVNLFALRDALLLELSDRLGMPDWYRRAQHSGQSPAR